MTTWGGDRKWQHGQEVIRWGVERLSAFLIWGSKELRDDCDSSFASLIFPFLPHDLTLGLLIGLIRIMLQNCLVPRHLNAWSVLIDIIYIHALIALCGGLKENGPQTDMFECLIPLVELSGKIRYDLLKEVCYWAWVLRFAWNFLCLLVVLFEMRALGCYACCAFGPLSQTLSLWNHKPN